MASERHKTIAELMNSEVKNRTFTGNEVAVIELMLKNEFEDRQANGPVLNSRKKADKKIIQKRIANFANEALNNPKIPIGQEHIKIYRKCRNFEYEGRTGRCAWGYKNTRIRLGYDPETGRDIVEDEAV